MRLAVMMEGRLYKRYTSTAQPMKTPEDRGPPYSGSLHCAVYQGLLCSAVNTGNSTVCRG